MDGTSFESPTRDLVDHGDGRGAGADTLAARVATSARKGANHALDLGRAARSTTIVGPADGSSIAAAYVRAAGDMANTGRYAAGDAVMVVFEAGPGRRKPVDGAKLVGPYAVLGAAIEAGATFVIATGAERTKPTGIGEREFAAHLASCGYEEAEDGVFS